MLSREELEEIRERAKKATPETWHYSKDMKAIVTHYDAIIDVSHYTTEGDIEFISHAREDIPKLLETINKLETYRDRFEAYWDGYMQGQYDLQMDNLNGK
ncbi:hypothetical protein C4A75_09420 [Brevibacillus laterosporus]|uniref:hypothetical protein n=1 Tax=Brevibacillus laterosporus TaxID=1465 RepID=UPI000CE45540|nr:hypothetical protein [Brevibacillus laterosporus]PPA84986.1 hypothetical protein C4A75_09420 [Brevibacillus laterosporus]